MKELILEISPFIAPVLTACLGVVLAWLAAAKSKAELTQKNIELEKTNKELHIQQVQLQQTIIDGTYTICPNCGERIYLKDIKFYVNNLEDQK